MYSLGLFRLRIHKLHAGLAFNGDFKSLPVADSSYEETADRVLWVVTPVRRPGWTIVFLSTFSKKKTLRHLVLKLLLQDLNENEKQVLTQLAIQLPEDEYKILEIILLSKNNNSLLLHRQKFCDLLVEHKFLGIVDPERELPSYLPELLIQRVWTEKTQLAPKRYIGIGYNDHGSLSSAPSWKEQQTEDGEKPTRLFALLFSMRSTIENNLYRNTSFRGFFRLKSSKQSETGKGRSK